MNAAVAPASTDAVVVGAGIIGACCALQLGRAGLSVCVVDRGAPAAGTTGAGEGNLLVSDKLPGPELDLARRSLARWRQLGDELAEPFELESKGGLVVAHDGEQLGALQRLADSQRRAGVVAERIDVGGLRELEPRLSTAVAGGVFYPEDAQVQPMLACRAILRAAQRLGAVLMPYTEVTGLDRSRSGAVSGLSTDHGRLTTPVVVDAAGPWSAELAGRFGSAVLVRPRRGQILVTEPLGHVGPSGLEPRGLGAECTTPTGREPHGVGRKRIVHHKVYEADYVGTVMLDDDATVCSAVVEGTASGTILIGSSREFVGFDRRPNLAVLAEIARRAIRLFPFLAGVRTLRTYLGFRPSTPDHLPIIGEDPAVPGLFHATGHEGAGIGLAPATAELLAGLVGGTPPTPVDPTPFAPGRFAEPAEALDVASGATTAERASGG